MPINYSLYAKNWKTEIRPAILRRANNCCEKCGVGNYAAVRWDKESKEWERACGNIHVDAIGMGDCTYKEARILCDFWNESSDGEGKWIVICLTIAHLDHNINNNNYSNLSALCQRCHINHDKDHHRQNAKETIEKKKGLQSLF